jgi:hypothetical protein
MGPAAIMAHQVATMGQAAIMAHQAVTMGPAAIMGMAGIMGMVATTDMETRTALVLGSALDGADGDQGGGVLRHTPIIHTTRTIQRRRLLSNNSPKCMFSRISRSPGIGTTARIPRATTLTLNPARADG